MATTNDTACQACSKCKHFFALDSENFHKDKKSKSGFVYMCKACVAIKSQKWHEDNKEYARATAKQYYAEHKDTTVKEYKERNAEQINQSKRDWRKNNPDKVKKHKSESQKRHRNSSIARVKRHYAKYPERRRAHTLNRIAMKKAAPGKHTHKDVLQMYEDQEHRCAYCGITLYLNIPKDVHVDHVHPLSRGGSNWPDNLALSCASCNQSKNDMTVGEWQKVRGW